GRPGAVPGTRPSSGGPPAAEKRPRRGLDALPERHTPGKACPPLGDLVERELDWGRAGWRFGLSAEGETEPVGAILTGPGCLEERLDARVLALGMRADEAREPGGGLEIVGRDAGIHAWRDGGHDPAATRGGRRRACSGRTGGLSGSAAQHSLKPHP